MRKKLFWFGLVSIVIAAADAQAQIVDIGEFTITEELTNATGPTPTSNSNGIWCRSDAPIGSSNQFTVNIFLDTATGQMSGFDYDLGVTTSVFPAQQELILREKGIERRKLQGNSSETSVTNGDGYTFTSETDFSFSGFYNNARLCGIPLKYTMNETRTVTNLDLITGVETQAFCTREFRVTGSLVSAPAGCPSPPASVIQTIKGFLKSNVRDPNATSTKPLFIKDRIVAWGVRG